MEAQIRRLWPRRKSLKKSSKPEATGTPQVPAVPPAFEYNAGYEGTVSGPPPEVGTLPYKPSDEAKSRKSFGHSKARSAAVLQEFRSVVATDAHARAKSTGGIQPILLGISRPVTPGSMQRDVMEAANGVGKSDAKVPSLPVVPAVLEVSRLDTAASLPEARTAQRFRPAPRRHVDIMSFATATGKHLEAYNEEIAERNLDLVALATKSPTTTYVPRLQYQEDAASRNAAAMGYRYKRAAPNMQTVPEGRRSNSLNNTALLDAPSTSAQHGYKHEGVNASTAPKLRSLHDSSLHHSRTGSGTSKTSTPLPPIPQELWVDETERAIPGLDSRTFSESLHKSQAASQSQEGITRYPSLYGTPIEAPKLSTRANQGRPIANGYPKEHVHPLHSNPYQDPVAEFVDPPTQIPEYSHSRQAASRSSHYPSDHRSRKALTTSRTSSADRGRPVSALSQGGDSSDRTFMDLTEDGLESISQLSSRNGFLESPILAQARIDMPQVHRAQVVGLGSHNQQDNVMQSESAANEEALIRSLQMLNRQSKRWSGAYSDTGSFYNEQPLAFSEVTTVSSMSPASRAVSKFGRATESSRQAGSRNSTSQSLTSRQAPSSDIARPRTEQILRQRHIAIRSADSRDDGRTSEPYADTPPKAYTEPSHHLATQVPQVLHTSPDSLSSGDFIDPSRSFGVLTRDFATAPNQQATPRPMPPQQKSQSSVISEPARLMEQVRPQTSRHQSQPSLPQEQRALPRRHLGFEHNSGGTTSNTRELPAINEPPRSPQLDHVDTPTKELTASSFDEADFARKQAQARAALLRLQMSLEEQYDMSPGRPDSSAQRHVARQILDQSRKPQPDNKKTANAPTSMFYEKKEYQRKAPKNRPTAIRTPSEETIRSSSGYTKQGPNSFASSVYSAVTIAPTATRPTMNGHTKSSNAGSASHSYNYANSTSNNANGAARAASTFPNPPLTPVLPSPAGTEVSLSSFPMPTAAPESPEQRGRKGNAEPERPRTARMHSTKSSVASIASVYSIPRHMVPARDSSRRDQFEEEAGAW